MVIRDTPARRATSLSVVRRTPTASTLSRTASRTRSGSNRPEGVVTGARRSRDQYTWIEGSRGVDVPLDRPQQVDALAAQFLGVAAEMVAADAVMVGDRTADLDDRLEG